MHGYILATSQWQRWRLFSPDPLLRVSRYAVEREDGGAWHAVAPTHERIRSWPLRMLRRLEERSLPARAAGIADPLVLRLLVMVCRDGGLPADTPVRLQRRFYVIPKPERALAWWRSYEPEWREDTLGEDRCS